MKIFVTGGSGYIGGAVTRALKAAQHEVIALTRSDSAATELAKEGTTVQRGDCFDPGSYASALRDVDGIVHVAVGMSGGVGDRDFAAFDAMADALAGTNKPLILTSGLGVYFGNRAPVVDEQTPLDDVIPPQVARVKLENHAVRAAERDVRVVVLRPAHAYGQGRAGIFTRIQLEHAKRTGVAPYIGDGANLMSFVHIDDLAAAYLAALVKGRAGARYNVLASTLTTREVAAAVSFAVGAEGRTRSIPLAEAKDTWGPLGPLLANAPPTSALRAAVELEWSPRAPSLQWELVHGSLRSA
jgi:nucleoside-diphosphate-sugar epimerase